MNFKNFTLQLFSNIFIFSLGLLSILFLTNFLSVQNFSKYSLTLTFSVIVSFLLHMNLMLIFERNYNIRSKLSNIYILFKVVKIINFQFLILIILSLMFIRTNYFSQIILGIINGHLISLLSTICINYKMSFSFTKMIAINVIHPLINLFCILIVINYSLNWEYIFILKYIACISLVYYLLHLLIDKNYIFLIYRLKHLKNFYYFGLKLLYGNVGWRLILNTDALAINYFFGSTQQALYSSLNSIKTALDILVSSGISLLVPNFYRKIKSNYILAIKPMVIFIFCFLLVLLLSYIVILMYINFLPEKYYDSKKFVVPILFASFLFCLHSVISIIINYLKKNIVSSYFIFMSSILLVLSYFIFMPRLSELYLLWFINLSVLIIIIFQTYLIVKKCLYLKKEHQ